MRKYEINLYRNGEVITKTYYESPVFCEGAVVNHLDFMLKLNLYDRITAKCIGGMWSYDSEKDA